MRTPFFLLALATSSVACGPKDLPRDEIEGVLFSDKGVLGGYAFGDSWSEIKAKHAGSFRVNDDMKQLRQDFGDDTGSNGYFLVFRLDPAGKVVGMEASVQGQKQNTVIVKQLFEAAVTHYDKSVSKGQCDPVVGASPSNDTTTIRCDWLAPGKPRVEVKYMEMRGLDTSNLSILVRPAS